MGAAGETEASAPFFLSLNGETGPDVISKGIPQGKKPAAARAARMLKECMERGITVHWDAQNDASRHPVQKSGFRIEAWYSVYRLPQEGFLRIPVLIKTE